MPSLPKPRLRRSARARGDSAHPAAPTEPNVEVVEHDGLRWLNIERPRPIDRAWLEEHFDFHPLDYEDVLSRNQRPKIDEYDDYLFIVLYFPVFDKAVGRLNAAELDIFIGPDFLITLPNTPVPPVEYLFERCRSSEEVREQLFSKGSGYLLYKIVDDSFDYCFPMLRKIGNKLERLEEDIFEGRSEEVVRDISNVKQEIINFRKVVRPERAVLRDLERTKQRYLAEDLEVYFDDIVDASERIWDMLENYKEVIEALEDTNESVLSHRVNEVLRVLTAFSVVVLPLTLFASIWGMNVDFPFDAGTAAFWAVVAAMIVMLVGMVGYFRARGWLSRRRRVLTCSARTRYSGGNRRERVLARRVRRVRAGEAGGDPSQVAVAARVRELAHGAVVSHEPAYEGELVLAEQLSGVAAAGVADALELLDRRDAFAGTHVDQQRGHAVTCRQEAVLLDQLARARLWPGTVAPLELDARQRLDERGESGHVLDVRLAVHDPDLDGAVARLQAHVPPQERGVGDQARAPEPTNTRDPVGVAAEAARQPGARKGVKERRARRGEAGWPALPERRVRRQREQQRQVGAQSVEQPDRTLGAGHADMDVRRERRLAAREHAHRVADLAIAGIGGEHRVARERGRMRARDGGAQTPRGQGARHPAAQLSQLGNGVAYAAVHAGGDLHHRCVGLERHAIAQIGRQPGTHLIRTECQRPVVRVEEHELLLDADRELVAGRARPPRRPRRNVRHDHKPPSRRCQSRALAEMPARAVLAVASETSAATDRVSAMRRRRAMEFLLGVAYVCERSPGPDHPQTSGRPDWRHRAGRCPARDAQRQPSPSASAKRSRARYRRLMTEPTGIPRVRAAWS
jgi:magnesium transporter